MPFKSEAQRKFMWARHPAIAQRWTAEFGSTPQSSGQSSKKHSAADDYKNLSPGPRARHTPFRATEQEATAEPSGLYTAGGRPQSRSLGAAVAHKGLKGRDVRAAATAKIRKG